MFVVVLVSTLVGLAATALALRGLQGDADAASAQLGPDQPEPDKAPRA